MIRITINQRNINALRNLAQAIRDLRTKLDADNEDLEDLLTEAATKFKDRAKGTSPFVTGTLSNAHILTTEHPTDNSVKVGVTIAEGRLNPVFGGYADEYAPGVNARRHWWDDAYLYAETNIYPDLTADINDLIKQLLEEL